MTRPALHLVRGPSGPLPLRARLEAEVERLIALLDAMDGDPDLEPWLADNGAGVWDDREGGDVLDEGEPDEDSEPSLGWSHSPSRIALGWSYALGGPAGGDGDE